MVDVTNTAAWAVRDALRAVGCPPRAISVKTDRNGGAVLITLRRLGLPTATVHDVAREAIRRSGAPEVDLEIRFETVALDPVVSDARQALAGMAIGDTVRFRGGAVDRVSAEDFRVGGRRCGLEDGAFRLARALAGLGLTRVVGDDAIEI